MKALVLDMDGTILDHSGRFPRSLVAVLAALKEKGMLIFFATGRTHYEITEITPGDCPLDGYVAASGMGVYVDGRLIDSASFDPDFVSDMIAAARRRQIYYEIHTLENSSRTLLEDKGYSAADISRRQPETMKHFEYLYAQQTLESTVQWVPTLSFEHVVKIFFFSTDTEKIGSWYNHLRKHQDESDYALYTTSVHNAEIMLRGRNKATGLETLMTRYGLSYEDVHVIGDSMNDLPLFDKAGKRTAMKNSVPSILEAADDVTAYTCDEDGLSRYLSSVYL